MALALASILAVLTCFLGAGLWMDALPLPRPRTAPALLLRGAVGLALLAAALNLFLPLDDALTRTVWLLAALAIAVRWRRVRDTLAPAPWPALGGLGALALAGAACAVARGPEYDTGLYHVQTLLWQAGTAVPTGLANLHHRLAYNSAWHLLAGVVDAGATPLAMAFSVNAALLATVLLGLGWRAALGTPGERAVALALLGVLSLPFLNLWAFEAGSPATDTPAMLVVLWALTRGTAAAEGDAGALGEALEAAVLATLIKTSSAPILLLPAGLALVAWRAGGRPRWAALAVGGLAVVPWVLRGVALSGCVAFPLPVLCLEALPWVVPPGTAAEETRIIRDWARTPSHRGAAAPGWSWIEDWARYHGHNLLVVALAGVLLLGVVLGMAGVARWRRHAPVGALTPLTWPLAAAGAGLVAWFLGAPDPRLGLGFLVGAAGLALAAGARLLAGASPSPLARRTALALVGAAVLGAGVQAGRQALLSPRPFPATGYQVRLRSVPLQEGGVVHATRQGEDQCWASPPPCTPYPDPNLRQVVRFGRIGYEAPVAR